MNVTLSKEYGHLVGENILIFRSCNIANKIFDYTLTDAMKGG